MKAIYAIRCKTNGKMYIGKTDASRIPLRINEHMDALKRNAHKSRDFQSDFNNFGKSNFEFYILEIYSSEDLQMWKPDVVREYEWMKKYRTTEADHGYNSNDFAAISHIKALENLIDFVEGLPPESTK